MSQHDIAGANTLEPFVGKGGTGDIAAQPFEFLALIGAAAHCGVKAEAVRIGAPAPAAIQTALSGDQSRRQ